MSTMDYHMDRYYKQLQESHDSKLTKEQLLSLAALIIDLQQQEEWLEEVKERLRELEYGE